jgi:hypothetical protein
MHESASLGQPSTQCSHDLLRAIPRLQLLLWLGSGSGGTTSAPFPLSIEEDCFEYDIGNLSKAPTCDKNGLFFEPAGQDREEFIVSQGNLLRLSAIISRAWSEVVEEDDSHVRIYLGSNTICCRLQGFSFQTVCYDPSVGLNILLLDDASGIDLQPLVPSMKILQWQLRQNLQCKGVVLITTSMEGSKVC